MKKVFTVLLMALMIFASGCSEDKSSGKLTPKTDLPEFTENFSVVFEHVDVTEAEINEIMGYLVAAYEFSDAESACKYIYEQDYMNKISDIRGKISNKASLFLSSTSDSERDAVMKLTNQAYYLAEANLQLSKWQTKYSHEKTLSMPSYKKVQSGLKDPINAFSKVFYGKEIV